MYRTERIFIVTALVIVGLGLLLALNRGVLSSDEGAPAALIWRVWVYI